MLTIWLYFIFMQVVPKVQALRDEYMRYAVEKCSSILREYRSALETIAGAFKYVFFSTSSHYYLMCMLSPVLFILLEVGSAAFEALLLLALQRDCWRRRRLALLKSGISFTRLHVSHRYSSVSVSFFPFPWRSEFALFPTLCSVL